MKKIRTRRLAVMACVVALVGPPGLGGVACTRPHPPPSQNNNTIGSIASEIQGGKSDTTSTFAVAVLDSSNETCSGTLIAPNLVLTARHCIATDTGGSFVDCTADTFQAPGNASSWHVSTAASATFDDSPYVGSKILVPTDTKFCGNDIALIILKTKVPKTEAKPATPAIDPSATATYGTTITAIGYGTTASGANDDGSHRRRDAIPITCIPGDKTLTCDPSDFQMTAKELATGDGLCEGDSGSGAYVTSSISGSSAEVIGVLSRASDNGTKCTDAVYTRTDAFRAFLIAGAIEAATAGGYPAPTWAGGDGGSSEEPDDASTSSSSSSSSGNEDPTSDSGTPAIGPTAAPPPDDTGCGVAPSRSSSSRGSSGSVLALTLLGIAFVARRKRSRESIKRST